MGSSLPAGVGEPASVALARCRGVGRPGFLPSATAAATHAAENRVEAPLRNQAPLRPPPGVGPAGKRGGSSGRRSRNHRHTGSGGLSRGRAARGAQAHRGFPLAVLPGGSVRRQRRRWRRPQERQPPQTEAAPRDGGGSGPGTRPAVGPRTTKAGSEAAHSNARCFNNTVTGDGGGNDHHGDGNSDGNNQPTATERCTRKRTTQQNAPTGPGLRRRFNRAIAPYLKTVGDPVSINRLTECLNRFCVFPAPATPHNKRKEAKLCHTVL